MTQIPAEFRPSLVVSALDDGNEPASWFVVTPAEDGVLPLEAIARRYEEMREALWRVDMARRGA